ncbi:MAG: hypothetical protein U0165_07710 [Polyangiaceae bacterium]
MKVLLHVINGVGLGHLTRALNIARELRAMRSDLELLVLTNAHDTSMLEHEGIDFVQLPPRLSEPYTDPTRAKRALPVHLEAAAGIAVIRSFAPSLVVFDTRTESRRASCKRARSAGGDRSSRENWRGTCLMATKRRCTEVRSHRAAARAKRGRYSHPSPTRSATRGDWARRQA